MVTVWLVPILAIGALIFLHELGHFLAARLVGVRVEEFAVGFPPRIFNKIVGKTRYSLGIIFLGGFVRLRGQNLEDEDPTEEDNYAAKSKKARFFIIIAGPAVNILLALILMPLAYKIGFSEPTYFTQSPPIIEEVAPESFASEVGFRKFDHIRSLNGAQVTSWQDFYDKLTQLEGEARVRVVKAFDQQQSSRIIRFKKDARQIAEGLGVTPLIPPIIGKMNPGWPAMLSGFKMGDKILTLDSIKIYSFAQVAKELQAKKSTPSLFTLERNSGGKSEIISIKVVAKLDPTDNVWRLGFYPPTVKKTYDWSTSIKLGLQRVVALSNALFGFLKKLVQTDIAKDEVGGPIMIAKMIGNASNQGISYLIVMVAFISFQLGFFNLLPLPVLDGGHIAFLGYELVMGKQPPANIRYRIQLAGIILLLGLMLFVTIQDILKL